jgi:extracellular serine/threonine protein kinase FAM20C
MSPAGNICFTGECSYYCDTTHATCGRPYNRMEGSVQIMLPNEPLVEWSDDDHPFSRSYNPTVQTDWEIDDKYCENWLFRDPLFHGRGMLDIIDMAVFDFLTGNMDRHNIHQITELGPHTFKLHLDNGRSFGRPDVDELSILEPLKQCCLFRYSTFVKLQSLLNGNLSKKMNESLKTDPLYPILIDEHLVALDRRLLIIFNRLSKCISSYPLKQVVIDDGY